jgi:formylglycine-generating enzyme required for sulfatase activity
VGTPQHRGRLSQGFWLADTACTQALWQAVMGSNPSDFSGDAQRPVEQVSGLDVREFLRKLEVLDPDYRMSLPTEAQWEYACRAGTTTPFSCGQNVTPEQVNYDGNHPYAKGAQGEYRRQTVAVKTLQPNPWGLYEMHGNVAEWCAELSGAQMGCVSTRRKPGRIPSAPRGARRVLGRLREGRALGLSRPRRAGGSLSLSRLSLVLEVPVPVTRRDGGFEARGTRAGGSKSGRGIL